MTHHVDIAGIPGNRRDPHPFVRLRGDRSPSPRFVYQRQV